ncbi:MAG TPA: LytR C-terminal domain-containing protein [Solirubrobacterales bacterium]|nr:LytR C-terminal domain-containing protein [Solirubrobacterales bacterium]
MSSLLKDVGAVAGLASFLGLALLALLYFAQARDIRRLRENASFLVEAGSEDGETVTPAERTATAVAAKEPEQAAAAAAATAPNEAEAFRRAELARQAAERRRRFEQRRRRPSNGRERPAWLSDWRAIAAIALIGVIVLAGAAFGVSRIVGGDSESDTLGDGGKNKGPCPPGQTRVAVLNGTPTPGLAATFAGPLKQQGYRTTPVGNTDSPFTTSVVMFDPQQQGKECAGVISQIVGIPKQQPMDNEIRVASEGDPVAVILGDDKAGAGGASTTGSGI